MSIAPANVGIKGALEWVDLAWILSLQIVQYHSLVQVLGLDECVEVVHNRTSFNSSTIDV